MTEHEPTLPPLPSRLSRLTTPTWEIEMLLSGAVVFALFQTPEPLQRWAEIAAARTGESGDMLVRLALVYGLIVNYALIAMFLVHLSARAYWVALVGLDSVFPGGVRWENFRQGPIARIEMQKLVGSLPELIERADNFSSLCFGFGLLVVLSALLGSVYAIPSAALALVISELAFDGREIDTLFPLVLGVVLLPIAAAGLLDRWSARFGGVAPGGVVGRAIARVFRMKLTTLPAPLMLVLRTNLRSGRANAAMLGSIALLVTALLLQISGTLRFDGYDYLPADVAGIGIDTRHYRDQRQHDRFDLHSPTIDSMLPGGRYLRLIVPYRPELHGPLVERECVPEGGDAATLAAGLAEQAGTDRHALEAALLACLARALDLRLDGVPVPASALAFSSDPDSGLRGLLAVLPIADLTAGRHEISLYQPPRRRVLEDEERLAEHLARGPARIAFWR
jgi:hypothetical protein